MTGYEGPPVRKKEISGEPLISDDRIRQILFGVGSILHRAIAASGSLRGVSYGINERADRPMLDDELEIWDRCFNIRQKIKGSAQDGTLRVADVSLDKDGNFTPSSFSHSDSVLHNRETVETNLPETNGRVKVPTASLDPQGVNYSVTPMAYFQGRYMGDVFGMPIAMRGEGLDHAYISIDILAQDNMGRWIISKIPGTSFGTSLYQVHSVVSSVAYFNTFVDKKRLNSLKGSLDMPNLFRISCNIHDLGKLDELKIPNDPKLKLYFWQLDRFIKKDALEQPYPFALLDTPSV